jgi:hypothetical protein
MANRNKKKGFLREMEAMQAVRVVFADAVGGAAAAAAAAAAADETEEGSGNGDVEQDGTGKEDGVDATTSATHQQGDLKEGEEGATPVTTSTGVDAADALDKGSARVQVLSVSPAPSTGIDDSASTPPLAVASASAQGSAPAHFALAPSAQAPDGIPPNLFISSVQHGRPARAGRGGAGARPQAHSQVEGEPHRTPSKVMPQTQLTIPRAIDNPASAELGTGTRAGTGSAPLNGALPTEVDMPQRIEGAEGELPSGQGEDVDEALWTEASERFERLPFLQMTPDGAGEGGGGGGVVPREGSLIVWQVSA